MQPFGHRLVFAFYKRYTNAGRSVPFYPCSHWDNHGHRSPFSILSLSLSLSRSTISVRSTRRMRTRIRRHGRPRWKFHLPSTRFLLLVLEETTSSGNLKFHQREREKEGSGSFFLRIGV